MEEQRQKLEQINLHKKLLDDYRARYSYNFSKIYHRYLNIDMLKFVVGNSHSLVLDCGCGNGILLDTLQNRFRKSIGCDLSFEMLKEQKARGFSMGDRLINADAEYLPFRNDVFGIVFCRGVLHHVPNPKRMIREMQRVLVFNGLLFISEPCNDSLLLRIPRSLYASLSRKLTKDHKAFFSKELKDLIIKNGFKIEKIKKFGFIGFPLCGMPDFLPLIKYLPFSGLLAKILFYIDRILAYIPIINRESWGIAFWSRKDKEL